MMSDSVDPRPSLGEILNGYERYTYKPETALAEFVDNSTASYLLNKAALNYIHGDDFQLVINITYNQSLKEIIIQDNAFGMDHQTFADALTIAKPPKIKGGRNEYGMGLKTAASWFGKRWIVETSTYGESVKYSAEIDILELMKTGDNLVKIHEGEADTKYHGTKIIIKELTRNITENNLTKLKKDLTSIYRRDLNVNHIKILINGDELSYQEPKALVEVIDGVEKEWKQEFEHQFIFDGKTYKFDGYYAIRSEGSYSESGFTLFRKGRVIIGGLNKNYKPEKIFNGPNSFVSFRLFGEINLDDFPVTQAKDDFDWELNGLQEAFVSELYNLCELYIKKTKEYRVPKGKNVDVSKINIESFGEDLVNDISSLTTKKIKADKTTLKFEKQGKVAPKYSSYEVDMNVLDSKIHVVVKFVNNPDDDLLDVKAEDFYNPLISINLGFPIFAEMKYDEKFINFMQKFLIILVIAENYAYKLSIDKNKSIASYDIRVYFSQILSEISKNQEGNNGFVDL